MVGGSSSSDPSKPFVVEILLKTRIKSVQNALDKSSRVEAGVVPVNINIGLTWDQLFKNLEIPVFREQHIIRSNDKKNHITWRLTDKISNFIGQFPRKLSRYPARILLVEANSRIPTLSPDISGESNRTTAVNRQNKRIAAESTSPSPAKRARGRPRKSDNLATKNLTNNLPAAKNWSNDLPTAKKRNKMSEAGPSRPMKNKQTNNSPSKTAVKKGLEEVIDLSNGASESDDNNDCDTDSQLSIFTTVRKGRLGSSPVGSDEDNGVDVKAAVVQSIMKNLSNTVLWRMKKEVDDLKATGKWIKIIHYIPRIGHLISDIFDEKHFMQPNCNK